MKKSPLAAILAASSLISAQAADVTWIPTGTSPFTTPTNWSDGAVPDTADDAYIANGGTATIGGSDVVGVSRLLINNGTVSQTGGFLSTVPFGDFNSPGAYVIGGVLGQTGTLNASGDATLSGGRFRIGVDGGTGAVSLSGTSSYLGDPGQDAWIGAAGSTGSLTLSDSAKFNITNNWITVGNDGQGTLTMSGASELNILVGNAVFGAGAGGVSTTTLSGSSKILVDSAAQTAVGEIWIGNAGSNATVDVSGTASITAQGNWLAIGRDGGTGTLTIRDQGVVKKLGGSVDQNMAIGSNGTGTVNVQDGGTLSSGSRLFVGERATGNGTLNVSGGTVSSNDDFVVGEQSGSLGQVVATGGTFTVGGWTKLGRQVNSTGEMTISGATQFTTNGKFVMGDSGTGTLTMQGGTVNTLGETWIGQGGDGTGVFNLEGGSYTSGQWIAVGREGARGTLNMSGGTLTHSGTGAVDGAGFTGTNFVVLGNVDEVAVVNHTGGTINNQNAVTVIGEGGASVGEWNATGGTANLGDTRPGFNGVGTMTIGGTANYTSTSVYIGSNATGVGTLNLDGGTYGVNFLEEGAGTGFVNFDGGVLKALQNVANIIRDFEAGDVIIEDGGLLVDTNGFTVGIEHALEGIGGLTKLGAGTLTLSGANTYLGNTLVSAGTLSSTTASFGDFSSINILNGSILDLNFLGSDLIAGLYFNGILQQAGVWGALGSGAQFESSFLTGTGTITNAAIPEPSTVALVIGGLALVGLRMRSRARAHQA